MMKNFIIALLFSLSVGSIICLVIYTGDISEAERKRNRDYEFVDFEVGCECGNKMQVEFPSDYGWPIEVFCGGCNMKYTLSREATK